MASITRPRRSFIFCPGTNCRDMFPKACATGTDIVCVDLEDAVAPHDKEDARKKTMDYFETADLPADRVECMVRFNCLRTPDGMKDVQALLNSKRPPPAVMLAKTKWAAEVSNLSELLDQVGHKTRLHVIIETNEALETAWEIARCSRRIDALFFGGVDMQADLRCDGSWESLLYARSRIAHAAAGAGVDAIDVPYLDLNDFQGMKLEAERSKALGFCGKGSIHPSQVPVINKAFTPSDDEVARAKRVVDAFERANTGLVVLDGKLLEAPVLRSMHRVLAQASATSRPKL